MCADAGQGASSGVFSSTTAMIQVTFACRSALFNGLLGQSGGRLSNESRAATPSGAKCFRLRVSTRQRRAASSSEPATSWPPASFRRCWGRASGDRVGSSRFRGATQRPPGLWLRRFNRCSGSSQNAFGRALQAPSRNGKPLRLRSIDCNLQANRPRC